MGSSKPYTPCFRNIQGTELITRDITETEIRFVYSLFKHFAQTGTGYSLSEIGSLEHFRETFLKDNITIVMQNTSSEEILYASIIRPSKFLRHQQKIAVSTMTAVNPNVRTSKPLALEAIRICLDIARSKGYDFGLYTTTLVNHRALRLIIGAAPNTILGTLPHGIYLEGHGWCDLIFYRAEHAESERTTLI